MGWDGVRGVAVRGVSGSGAARAARIDTTYQKEREDRESGDDIMEWIATALGVGVLLLAGFALFRPSCRDCSRKPYRKGARFCLIHDPDAFREE
jgi:hypothetical protein